ncbi:glycoside hydrolase family 70 protein [Convivina intestini]|uniref:dextransucrase n=1 Tax=Convivina intestini TaxID=1505726 RepID=A0A2U1D5K7_9LACO|nr:glycoside hydrolase family 70 protein [Convivina intestini]PVY82822.1 putative secreted protein [Convivina intestini]CAH1856803.1 hypothetical protein R077811_01336 [Convivina intestini]SDC16063.1 KxYKxGKxW signal peptide containing protein [Leuconostocaceae bacterium R-53105]
MKQEYSAKHFKMYKSGKLWVYASLATISFLGMSGLNDLKVSADDVTSRSNHQQVGLTSVNDAVNQSDDVKGSNVQAPVSTVNSTSIDSLSNSSKVGSVTTSTSQLSDSTAKNGQVVDGSTQSQGTKGAPGSNSNHTSTSESTPSSTSSAVTPNNDDKANSINIFNLGDITTKGLSNDQIVQLILKQDKHLKFDNGKFYFVDDQGNIQKNFTAIINNQTLYFGKETGQLQSLRNQYTDGLTNISNQHNAAANLQTTSFTTTDGFMTADSWYRPKDILKNGQTWVPSGDNDFRPLLMSWWPDKNTQIAYLSFAKSKGWLTDNTNLNDDSQAYLTQLSTTVQANIEKQISAKDGQTDWLRQDISDFVKSQPGWNMTSEDPSNDFYLGGFQHGAVLYVNNQLTPWANSKYRLLNRVPTNQTGTRTDFYPGGFELLLGNDVDNSNPVVQAEQLNWLYYLLNFGTITNNDTEANFDSYRVDAPDNVDADLLQITADYMKAAFHVDQDNNLASQHISILEDWSQGDIDYLTAHGSNQLSMDPMWQDNTIKSLGWNDNRAPLTSVIQSVVANRAADSTTNVVAPNYTIIRSHDNQTQDEVGQILSRLYPGIEPFKPTQEQLKAALKVYDEDFRATDKKVTPNNIPAMYALLLSNKNTVPRVYYGDLYTDSGQYMSQQTIYFDALTQLMRDRVKYVAGGQTMTPGTSQGTKMNNIITSVRFGKGLNTVSDNDGQKHTDGMGVIISNDNNFRLENGETVTLHMGAAHANQLFRASLLTTADGLDVFSSDAGAPTMMSNQNGDLVFTNIAGVHNPKVSGYLAVWVPVGAADTQDVRTLVSTKQYTDGKTFHSDEALDSNLIYEGFSNFQSMPESADDYMNVKVAQNAGFFKSLGITSFEFPPQYRSSQDGSFLDSIVQNGYAFTDRYDLGFNTPTKYGTVAQLREAIKAVHREGMQAMADWVPDQLYTMPNKEVVTATRTDIFGRPIPDAMANTLYVTDTKGNGTDYQSVYGGAFLEELQEKYPQLFTAKQISTGKPIDGSVKIKTWSAKYLNGSNILGRGANYVLRDAATQQYFSVDSAQHFLPKQILGEISNTGFTELNGQVAFYSTSGYQAKNSFIQDGDNWYYFDQNGYMVYGDETINGAQYFFLPNGVQLRNADLYRDGIIYHYNKVGRLVSPNNSGTPDIPGSESNHGSGSGSTSYSGSGSTSYSYSGSTSTSTPPSTSTSTSESTSESNPPSGSTSTSQSTSTSESTPPSASTSMSESTSGSHLPPTAKAAQTDAALLGLSAASFLGLVGIKRYRRMH